MELIASFSVIGRPAPQGSKTYLGNGRFKEQSKFVPAWRNDVRQAALGVFSEAAIIGPVFTEITFLFARPKCHYISNNPEKALRHDAPYWHTSAPDRDKLERSTNDALTGVIWVDDSQVAGTLSQKIYTAGASGAVIKVYRLIATDLVELAGQS